MLTGCGGQEDTQAEPRPDAVSQSPTPESTPEPAPIALPACEVMNATAQQEHQDFGPEMFSEPAGETDAATFNEVSDPVAQEAMGKALQQRGCRWPVHSQGTVTEYVAELPATDQAALIDGLRADPGITEASLGEAASFSYTVPAPNPMMSATDVTHIFVGDVWIALFNYAGQREYVQAALDGVLAANPALFKGDAITTTTSEASCSGHSGQQALQKWGADVAGGPWDLSGQYSDVSGYDECGELSWIVLKPEPCCTRFSVTPVLFFHQGELVQEATVNGYALGANIERISDAEASVTFMWPGEDFAGAPSTAVSVYRWDEASGNVARSGDLPPS